ncbi:MAG: protein translocase subunit SecF, partial [Deltaproteobacteria bacterium]|nr:protein translocase subunit SecF [Deltaproteobacteria bacterium]
MSFELIKPNANFNFIGNRYKAFVVSGLLIVMSLASIAYHRGLNLGVDFKGGLLLQFRLSEDPGAEALRELFDQAGFALSSLQGFGDAGNEYLVNLSDGPTAEGQTLSESAVALLSRSMGQDKVEIRREEMVGPKVGQDLRQKALYAIYYSILIIIIYISGRFEKKWGTSAMFVGILLGVIYIVGLFGVGVGTLIIVALIVTLVTCYYLKFSFALGGILALIHDVTITTGVFSFLNKEITLSFVAAILTIIGYSLNDSIIVFDRIRENVQTNRRADYASVINKSINETLSRTILTSGTTALALVSLYFLGGPVNRDFALALL